MYIYLNHIKNYYTYIQRTNHYIIMNAQDSFGRFKILAHDFKRIPLMQTLEMRNIMS